METPKNWLFSNIAGRILVFLFFVFVGTSAVYAQTCDNTAYYSAGSGSFTDANRWSATSGGTGNYTYNPSDPIKHTFVVERGHAVTVNSAIEVNNLIVGNNGGAATLFVNANVTLSCSNDSIQIKNNGTLQLNGNYIQAPGANNLFSMVGGTLQVNSNIASFIAAFEDIRLNGGTVDYSYNGNQSIDDLYYYNLRLSGSGIKTLNNPITVASDINILASTTLEIGADNANISVAGNWINQGTFNTNSRIAYVEFNGKTNNQSVTGYSIFHGLRINKAAGFTLNLNDNIRVNSNISFTGDGILALGTQNLILSSNITQVNSISGTFSANRMIQLNGTATSGIVIKELQSASGFVFNYPVGTGSLYTPIEVGPLSATVTGTATIAVNTVPYTSALTNIVKRYGTIETSGITAYTEAPVKFYYDQTEEFGAPNLIIRMVGATTNKISDADADLNSNYFGAGSSNTALEGEWRFINSGALPVTYYSYQGGNYLSPSTWTTDPSGTTQVGMPSAGPTSIDHVVILNGRTVTITNDNNTLASLNIQEGGILNIGTTINHNFGYIFGAGTLRLASTTIPGGDITSFVSVGGGTIEYNNTADFTFNQLTYNNLIINLSATGRLATLAGNLTINGNFTIQQGTFRINNTATTPLTINVNGNVLVENAGRIQTGTGNATNGHLFNINGNFTNKGIARFSNLAAPDYTTTPANGYVSVVFLNDYADQYVNCNGQTEFYRIRIDKGIDYTYFLHIDASNTSNFALFGRNNLASNDNALAIDNGTCRLGPNIVLPCLTSDTYYVYENAQLWLDGAQVTFTTATGTNNWGLYLYGKLRLTSNSNLTIGNNAQRGIIMRETSAIQVESGALTANGIRTSGLGGALHRGAFIMSGGTITLNGITNRQNAYGTFSLGWPDNVIEISGGTINIVNPMTIGGSGDLWSLHFGSDVKNARITGGTFNLTIPNGNNVYINSTVPLWDVNFIGTNAIRNASIAQYNTAGGANPPTLAPQPLVVQHDLNLINNAVLNTTGNNLSVGRNFTMSNSSVYNTGDNSTIFNGSGAQSFTNAGSINSNSGAGLYNLDITNSSKTDIVTNNLIVRNGLNISSGCSLNDLNHTISVAGNITNSGTHTSGANGGVLLNGAAAQSIGGDGNGIFGNLIINKASGLASFTANQALTGNLRLANGLLSIDMYNLSLSDASNVYSALTGTGALFSNAKMIGTAGNLSDGGITKMFSPTVTSFTYPIGTGTVYTPMTANVNASAFGVIKVIPVNKRHPALSIPPATVNDALSYFWKVSSQGFTGVSSNSLQFTYQPSLMSGGEGTDVNFLTGRTSGTNVWETQSGVDAANNRFTYTSASIIDGEYTAGNTIAFNPAFVLESRTTGNWEDLSTWRKLQGGIEVEAISTTIPNASTPVIINSNHIVNVAGPTAANSASLEIRTNAVLDLGTTVTILNHNFGTFISQGSSQNGTIRISSTVSPARFPAGDFGDFFNATGGTVEYYRTSADFILPLTTISGQSIQTYMHLSIVPSGGAITLPNQNLRIFGNLSTNGTSAGNALISAAANGDLQIDGNVNVSGRSSLMYQNNVIRNVKINSNITVENNATIGTITTGAVVANTINIAGSVINNGAIRFLNGTRYVNAAFTGVSNASITGTGANTIFNRLILDKGIDTTYTLEVNATSFSIQATSAGTSKALELKNGTFKLSSNQTIIISSGNDNGADFQIPATTQLWINNGNALINATGFWAGLYLGGKLKVSGSGVMNISSSGTNDNYIEYSGVGKPTIEINGGQLIVGSQIRRPTTVTTGSLTYIQTGGTAFVGTQAAPTSSRGVFEVLNPGSEFRMTGGTLTIVRPQTTPEIAAFYLNPASSDIQNSTIQIGVTGTVVSNIQINSSVPLWNLTIGTSAGTSITSGLSVNNLVVSRNLTIHNGATFNANNLNVSIGGDLTATGTYTCGTNTTIFNGNAVSQNITGLLIFNNVNISNTSATGLVSLNNNIQINKLLTLSNGVLFDNGRTITVNGNVENSAVHRTSGTGRLVLTNTTPQYLSGSGLGIFGSIELNNRTGVDLTTNQTINNTLTFTKGLLNIANNRLTLGSTFAVAGTVSDSAMIRTSGSQSDNGIQLNIVSGAFDYIIPFGVTGKYTPARYTSTTNTNNGYITVKPINSQHPLTSDALNKELNYYWQVSSNGLTGTTLTQEYRYIDLDVIGRGIENYYVGARYSGAWTLGGAVNSSINRILFSNVNYIDGDYTAGESSEFNLVISAYQTATSGNWENGSTWVGGVVPLSNASVIINPNHVVTINTASKRAYSLYIRNNAEVIVGTTTNHNFGITHGTGTLTIGSNIFPGGDYTGFVAADSGTIKYTHAGNISNVLTAYNNLIIAGSGTLNLPYITPITIRGNLTIESGTLSAAGQRMILYRNLTVNGIYAPGTSTIEFRGSSLQTITNASLLNFWNMTVNNTSGIGFTGSFQLNNNLSLTNGIVNLSGTNEAIFAASATHSGASDLSYIQGVVRKTSTGNGFTFPVGSGQYRPVTFGSFNGEYTVAYINGAYNPGIVASPVTRASDFEYYNINRVAGTSNPSITMRWTNANQIPVISSISNLRMVYWNGTAWEEASSTPSVTGNLSAGTITVNGFANSGRLTFGSMDTPVAYCPSASSVIQGESISSATYTWTTDSPSLVSLSANALPNYINALFASGSGGSGNIILTVSRGATIIAIKYYTFQVYPAAIITTINSETSLTSR